MASINKKSKKHIEADDPLVIPDACEDYPLNYFNLLLQYRDDLKSVLISYEVVQDRIEVLANRIFDDLHIDIPKTTYLRNDRSLPMSLEFIHLLIVEDIIGTSVTMIALKNQLEKFQPKTIHVVSLFTKRRKDQRCVCKPDYRGFEILDHFIVGYTLDYNEYFRDLEHICILKESGIRKYEISGGDKIE